MKNKLIIGLAATLALNSCCSFHWQGEKPNLGIQFDKDKETEAYCMSLNAKRFSGSKETALFEAAGCCYNDGFREPRGC